MNWNYYNGFKNSIILNNGAVQFLTDDIKVMLITDQYVFDASHATIGALVEGDEIEGDGYDAGGILLTGKSRVDQALFADNVTWESLTATVSGAILYKSSGGILIAHLDFEFTFNPFESDFLIIWDDEGVFLLSSH